MLCCTATPKAEDVIQEVCKQKVQDYVFVAYEYWKSYVLKVYDLGLGLKICCLTKANLDAIEASLILTEAS